MLTGPLIPSLSHIWLVSGIGGGGGWKWKKEEAKHEFILFLVSDNITARIQLKGTRSLHHLLFELCTRFVSLEWLLELSIWHTH